MFARAIAVAAGLAALLFAGSAALADPALAGSMDRPRLGVVIVELTPELRRHFGAPGGHGVLVARVVPGSAAERAGVGVGDVVVEVGGRPVASADEILSALDQARSGT
jgi:serine protease Do